MTKIITSSKSVSANPVVVAKAIKALGKKPVAAKTAKPVAKPVAKVAKPVAKPVALSARAKIAADAAAGIMPAPLSWTSPSDKRYAGKIDILNAAAAKRDIKALNAVDIIPYSSYPKRMIKWRELTIAAIKAKAGKKAK